MPPRRAGKSRDTKVKETTFPVNRKRKTQEDPLSLDSHNSVLQNYQPASRPNQKQLSSQNVIEHLNKITSDVSIGTSNKKLSLQLIVSSSEGDYLIGESESHLDLMEKTFGTSFKITEKINAVVERTLTITGDAKQISKSALYTSYLLLRLNNHNQKFIHINSSNYHLQLLVNDEFILQSETKLTKVAENCDIVLDMSSIPYNFSSNRSIFIKGTFLSLLNFILVLLELLQTIKVDEITQFPVVEFPITGTYAYPLTLNTQESNKNLLNKSLKQFWDFLYPVEKSEVSSTDYLTKQLQLLINDVKKTYLSSSSSVASTTAAAPASSSRNLNGHGFNNNLGNGGINSQSQVIKTSIEVPSDLAGNIIGKKGATINEIRSNSNCNIKLLDKVPNSTDEFKTFEFNGLPETIVNALGSILELFDE